jgi:3-oxoacyl-[acyl-carrier-protein] synthase II
MTNQRVVITGLGTINAVSRNIDEFTAALREGRSGIRELSVFDPDGHMTGTAAEIRDFDPSSLSQAGFSLKRMSRADWWGITAALEALKQAGLYPLPEELAEDTGLSVGGGAGGLLAAEDFYRGYLERKGLGARYSQLASVYGSSTADRLASHFKLWGPKATFMTACSSGGTSLGFARDLIAAGQARVMLAGGAEPICRMTYTAFNALRAVDPEHCRPFDKNRQGLTLGEGAGFMVLESLEHAQKRGARILAEFLGYGLSGDAHHMTAPDPTGNGAARAMKAALKDAHLAPDNIDYINAHGTGTPANDVVETAAIKEVFGPRAYRIPVSSTKSMIGHTLGAAGSLEAVASILALIHGFAPPTIHYQNPDPDCDLDYVVDGARELTVKTVLSNSFAFGGNNTAVILGQWREGGAAHV